MRRSALAILGSALVVVGLFAAPTAQASTGGAPDPDGRFGNVAMLVNYAGGEPGVCSGTLVSPAVVLTAAHCVAGTDGMTLVTFEPTPSAEGIPVPGNPAEGYAAPDATGHYLAGVAHHHDGYSWFADLKNWNDVGVVVLTERVEGIVPATLGSLDGLASNKVSTTIFTAVGYGAEMVKPSSGPRRAEAVLLPLTRRHVTMAGQKVTDQVLQTHANVHARKGTGATCVGDSGGPVFLDGSLVAVTSFGINTSCTGIGGAQRVDPVGVAEWLDTFME